MRILLLASGFNGLTQRVWLALRAAGHDVTVELSVTPMGDAVAKADPELIICPFLRERVPDEIWQERRTIIIHPGPPGDRGPSSLDWAITGSARLWGVTALQAVAELDAGPIWGSRTFTVPADVPRKSELYAGPVADAAVELALEVAAKAVDPAFEPEPLDYGRPEVWGRLMPTMRQSDRAFSWSDDAANVLRRIRAADGSPGVRAELAGVPVHVYDAHFADSYPGEPGTIVAKRHGALLVRTGRGALWIGHVKRAGSIKLPATLALAEHVGGVPELVGPGNAGTTVRTYPEITYRQDGHIGWLSFDFYNGAMSTDHCRRLAAAVRHAAGQDTRALVIQGGEVFSNGIHLNVIEAAPRPAHEAWHNIVAMNEVCAEILGCVQQVVVAALWGNAGAGGVMLALGADHVLVRDGVVLNPHYRTMGLSGSEYWTYVLPRRVGPAVAERLTEECLPLGSGEAAALGLADAVLPRDPVGFRTALSAYVEQLVPYAANMQWLRAKQSRFAVDADRKPLDAYGFEELAEMSRDIHDDRNGFAQARHEFVTKQRPTSTPSRLAGHRALAPT
ncbi:hydrogenase maturation protein [Actinocrispum wychmicini]|uniref:Putative two-component system hydrogenase maturation factor HypX/HoxX n=1 Tax=Actinocrispum wychmicini TaxID=1213861 RepID=A0A4R2JPE3_9PSEU|nr:hydrogenase maturation protein [Actinocrispum wychmicini]TCO60632.1 putative two-component system hydrogenase maturation factor HypX/HoxX [Actinocrispum wychmicini]